MLKRAVVAIIVGTVLCGHAIAQGLNSKRDANGIDEIDITARVGEIHLEVGTSDEIIVDVELEPEDGAAGEVDELIDGAELEVSQRSGRIQFEISFPDGRNRDDDDLDVIEKWRVRVPERLAAVLKMGVGEVEVEGIEGGVDTTVGVGEITVDVPAGTVRLKSSVGEVTVRHRAADVGRVDLDTNVGDVSLRVEDEFIEPERSLFVGSRLTWDGKGDDDINVTVNIGEIDVSVN
jgi:hypothetical protein